MSTMAGRIRNVADSAMVCKALRGCLRQLEALSFMSDDLEFVLKNHGSTLVEVLLVTPRPTARVLAEGALLAFPSCTTSTAKVFGERLHAALHHCRMKAKQMTTGKRLPPEVLKVCEALKKVGGSASDLELPVRSLKRKTSCPSSDGGLEQRHLNQLWHGAHRQGKALHASRCSARAAKTRQAISASSSSSAVHVASTLEPRLQAISFGGSASSVLSRVSCSSLESSVREVALVV